ncbi:MAG: T9SS type A sorting domain-containing protein, partial [Saprospiraceae bacterium]|nr:T9SS type A sorting domain-containing protein [Saprospiraceae bacterium]
QLPWVIYPEHCTWTDGQLDTDCQVMYEVDHTAPPVESLNFKAVKKGAVNGEVLTQISTRSNGLPVGIIASPVATGTELQFVALRSVQMTGMQLSLSSVLFDQATKMRSGRLAVSGQNYFADDELGVLNVAWVGTGGHNVEEGEVLFTAVVGHDAPQNVTEMIRFRGVFQDQFYTIDRQPLPVALGWLHTTTSTAPPVVLVDAVLASEDPGYGKAGLREDVQAGTWTLRPNPMSETAVLAFTAATDGQGQLVIYSSDLREVAVEQLEVIEGANQVVIDRDRLAGAGMYYFHLQVAGQTQTGKFVLID